MEGTEGAPSAPSAPSGDSAPSSPAPSAAPTSSPADTGGSAPPIGTGSEPSAPTTPTFATLDELGEFVKGRGGRVRIKANGEEQEVPWEEAQRYLPLGKGAYKKFEEAQALQRESEAKVAQAHSVARMVLEQPDEALRRMKPEQREAWLRKLAGGLEEEKLPAEQRELLQAKRELEQYRREVETVRQRQERESAERSERQAYERAQQVFTGAMDKAGLSKDPVYRQHLMSHMARVARRALAQGTDMTVEEVLDIARGESYVPAREMVSGMSVDDVLELLGEERQREVYGRLVSRWKQKDPMQEVPGSAAQRSREPIEQAPVVINTLSDWSTLLDEAEKKKR